MWFQNRRAKWRKLDHTKKGPGRPAHNAQPQSCSGQPLTQEEMERRESQRRERRITRQLEKQQKRMEAKGIHVDMDTLRREWERKQLDRGDLGDQEEVDVVGSDDDEEDDDDEVRLGSANKSSPFSIESLLRDNGR